MATRGTATSTIDAQGRVTHTQVGSLTPVDFTYDTQGRLTTITQGARQSSIAYDASGRPSTLTDAISRMVGFAYDAADRVTTQTLPDTRTIGFGYDANSNVTTLTPPGRPAHTFTYTPVDLTASYIPRSVSPNWSLGRKSSGDASTDTLRESFDAGPGRRRRTYNQLRRHNIASVSRGGVVMGWKTSIETRLKGREEKSRNQMHVEFWADLDSKEVESALDQIAIEWDVSAGLLRPTDRLDELFAPPPTKNPLRWLEYQTHSSDGLLEVQYRLSQRLRVNGMNADWSGKVNTVDDFIRAWCAPKTK